jgi:hypothetical protein
VSLLVSLLALAIATYSVAVGQTRPLPPPPGFVAGTGLTCSICTDGEVGLELRDHREDVEEQSADGVGGVLDRPSQAQAGLPGGELVGDRAGVGR